MNWFKEAVGIQEPIYGKSALHPVTDQTKTTPWTELKKEDLQWETPGATCVETQTFYVMTDAGHTAMVQIIYNCLGGIRTTCQFNCSVYYPNNEQKHLWTSDTLSHWRLDDSKTSFHADNCSFQMSEDGSSYTIKSSTSKQAIVDMKFTRVAPGFVVGKDGTTTYGIDPSQPWGKMRHAFWPRCRVEGSIMTQTGEIPMTGRGMLSHALQGIKPNFAASSWNFITFQSETHSAIMMEFTTPPSYGSSTVTIGGIVTDDEVLCAGAQEAAKHLTTQHDSETGWPVPTSVKYEWQGTSNRRNEQVSATLSGPTPLSERVDVLAQIPAFLKVIIAQAANSKPFIYQYCPKMELLISSGSDERQTIPGSAYMEATFITG